MGGSSGTEVGGHGIPLNGDRRGLDLAPREQRLLDLIEELLRRQRRRPDMVVRPWWTPTSGVDDVSRVGFVLEYCPGGVVSVELAVRGDRVTVDGPGGASEVPLRLSECWEIDGVDAGSPEILANHLLRLADRALERDV